MYKQQDCNSNRVIIPDGLYIIRYQVSPHDKAYVEYNHLRITNIMKQYYDKLCLLILLLVFQHLKEKNY